MNPRSLASAMAASISLVATPRRRSAECTSSLLSFNPVRLVGRDRRVQGDRAHDLSLVAGHEQDPTARGRILGLRAPPGLAVDPGEREHEVDARTRGHRIGHDLPEPGAQGRGTPPDPTARS